ncbi:Detected protein of unknown function [Hibiscus syriacus]|uniref:ABC transporter domain-containing protein n=1 Tax=Hibiscus syriacus TaxID=106335 RepID=A0A6A2XLY5_HIBSY|nr:Detected protein of unknown function [Hibiscus syriacus]
MVLPQQESSNITIHNSPASIMLTTSRLTENYFSVHAEPSAPTTNFVPIVSRQQPPTPLPFSVLSQTLRPVTLKFEELAYNIHSNATTTTPQVGKTTLLTALAGRLTGKLSGTMTYNGRPFSSSVKRRIGFVAQDDVLYPHLTVSKKLTTQEKIEQAELIIGELGLARCGNNVVGGPLLRGVSGGERKRVSIGLEMTVITTIHQPSSGLYRIFDKVLVLSEGYTIYCGQADEAIEYSAPLVSHLVSIF